MRLILFILFLIFIIHILPYRRHDLIKPLLTYTFDRTDNRPKFIEVNILCLSAVNALKIHFNQYRLHLLVVEGFEMLVQVPCQHEFTLVIIHFSDAPLIIVT